ncbi:MAG: sulfatase [Desulfatitalea sp. BRH_c12]|nr:MAG: sulfatase [Desulfatitalea sp. BRH_c12]
MKKYKFTASRMVLLISLVLAVFYNYAFFSNVTKVYPLSWEKLPFLCSLFVLLVSAVALLLMFFCSKYTLKPVLILVLTVSSLASYFMNTYSVVIDDTMIRNVVQTNSSESMDLLNLKMVCYFFFLGVLPSTLVYKSKIHYGALKTELLSRLRGTVILMMIMLATVFGFSAYYASFFREHKELRYYINPVSWIGAAVDFSTHSLKGKAAVVRPIGTDAAIPATDTNRELVILVVGETARADRFSLNGYGRETNPRLAKEDIINFPNMFSCGTTTAVSVPCMFSIFGKKDFSDKKARGTENLLDVLTHAGVHVLWRDNNSSSKGVAARVPYEDYKSSRTNPECDVECRDEGMLSGLQNHIDQYESGDILIVLHQMGNHGPAYYKRYPKEFEQFTPACETNQLEACTTEQINNAYDNAILYTDYFLAKIIALLKQNSGAFETAMIYMSDHGESLGENGVYLHGMPYFMAPDAQKHIPAVMWFGDTFKTDKEALKSKAQLPFSQDYLFHTILGLMEVSTSIYDKSLDILNFDN